MCDSRSAGRKEFSFDEFIAITIFGTGVEVCDVSKGSILAAMGTSSVQEPVRINTANLSQLEKTG